MARNEISIQHFFDEYKNADLNDPAVRDYLLDYFVDKIFVDDDTVILTAWYGDDKKEIAWGDLNVAVQKERKREKSSSASELVPPKETNKLKQACLSLFILQITEEMLFWSRFSKKSATFSYQKQTSNNQPTI